MTTVAPRPDGPALPAMLGQLRAGPLPGFTERVLDRLGLPVDHPGEIDEFALLAGPAGPLFVAFNARGIAHVLAADLVDEDLGRFAEEHRRRFGRPARPASRPPARLLEALRSGQGRGLAYDLRGVSDFEHAVLRKALDIPRGELRPYAWVAREIGRPKSVRAVGSALGRNPVPVLIPCHRVVLSDGRIGEYVFGPSMKRALLDAEAVDLAEVERLAGAGARLVGSDTTRRFCYPTCRIARRLADAHRVPFRSAGEARGAGYEPCTGCRPDVPQTA